MMCDNLNWDLVALNGKIYVGITFYIFYNTCKYYAVCSMVWRTHLHC